MKGVFADCKGKEGATDAELEEVLAKKPPTTKGSKCLHACAHENMGMVKEGKIMIDDVKKMIEKGFDHDKKLTGIMSEVVDECGSISDPDRCELADKLFHCFADGLTKRNLDPYNIA